MGHIEKYLEAIGVRPNVEPAPQLGLSKDMWVSMYADNHNSSGSIDCAKISPEVIEESVLKILKKYNVSTYTPATREASVGYVNLDNNKTFTLDEVIKVIDSMHTELIDKGESLWNTQDIKQYVDKNELIEKLKSC